MTAAEDVDRTQFAPRHTGSHVFPNDPLFSQLLRHARRDRVAIRDTPLAVSRTYGQLLDAVLSFRSVLNDALSVEVQARLDQGDEVYIGVLAGGGYEFTVAILAILALGAAFVPMFPTAPLEEISYLAQKSQQVMLLSTTATTELAEQVAQSCSIPTLNISTHLQHETRLTPLQMTISSDPPRDAASPALVIFTSGTTGQPKGVVLRRTYTHDLARAVADSFDITHDDVLLHALPVHHTTGLGTSFFPFLMAGASIEFHGKFDTETVLNRWLQGGLTVVSGVPTMYMRLKWHIEQLPSADQTPYKQAARQFRAFLCGSSALQDDVQEYWTEVRSQPILTRYGATEIPGCLRVPSSMSNIPKGCVGQPVPGVELKISPEGELLVKSPYMFARYLSDPHTTITAHDAAGYYRTGDLAHHDPHTHTYYILGRASTDMIKSGGYKISALAIERECLRLPYVREAMVVGVADAEFGERVGAVLVLKNDDDANNELANNEHGGGKELTISKLRRDLRDKLAGYKLPTVLRTLKTELPKGTTGKVQKKILGPRFLPSPGFEGMEEEGVQVYRPGSAGKARL